MHGEDKPPLRVWLVVIAIYGWLKGGRTVLTLITLICLVLAFTVSFWFYVPAFIGAYVGAVLWKYR